MQTPYYIQYSPFFKHAMVSSAIQTLFLITLIYIIDFNANPVAFIAVLLILAVISNMLSHLLVGGRLKVIIEKDTFKTTWIRKPIIKSNIREMDITLHKINKVGFKSNVHAWPWQGRYNFEIYGWEGDKITIPCIHKKSISSLDMERMLTRLNGLKLVER